MKNNPFEYTHTNKRYHTFDHYVRAVFGEKVVKIGLDGGFSCPNRDGTKGIGGCTFCAGGGAESMAADGVCGRSGGGVGENVPEGSLFEDVGGFAGGTGLKDGFFDGLRDACGRCVRQVPPLEVQYEQGRARLEKKWGRPSTIAYFQSYSSTYAPVERLSALYEQALSFEGVVGLTVGTRPDCLPGDVLDYLARLNTRTHLTVELGLQTTFEKTAARLNRCHSYGEFLEGYSALKERGIAVAVHLINGLPGEDREMMLENGRRVAALLPDFVKIHCLYYRKGSALAKEYSERPEAFAPISMEDYVSILADQIELFSPLTVIERVTGDADKRSLLAPLWTADKKRVVNLLDKTLKERDSYQGKAFGFVQNSQRQG